MTEADSALPRAHLRACLLLLLRSGPSHGYDLLEEVRVLGLRTVDAAGVYRALRTLEREGLVVSWWEESPSGPARRTYELSLPGEAALAADMAGMKGLHRRLGDLLHLYDSGSGALTK